MAKQSQETSTHDSTASKRLERAHRILDAASELILHWGYNKTTLDDISRQAGVPKGTLYTHWKTREDLFRALIKRERLQWTEDFLHRIDGDPWSVTLRGMFKHSALALMQRPMLKATLLRDVGVLGKLVSSGDSSQANLDRMMGFQTYLEVLRAHDLVRTDLDLQEEIYMISAIFTGYFLVDPLVPEVLRPSQEVLATMIAETVHRTLEPSRSITKEELVPLAAAFTQYLSRELEAAKARFQQELD